jgi:hypothetical protein
MVERGEDLRFAVESSQALRIGRDRFGQHFDGDVAIELLVAGAIHLAHSARAELGEDFVRTEANASGETHGWVRGL